MKTSTKYVLISAIGAAAVGGFLATSSSFAYKGNPEQKGPNYTLERHEEMTKAFEQNNYENWKELMQGMGRVSEVIDSEEKFKKFVEMRRLRLEGNIEDANKIRADLGLGNGEGRGKGKMGNGQSRGQNKGGKFIDENKDGICDHMQ